MTQLVVGRIAAILRDRYEPFGAERVALRIVECIQPGDRLGEQLEAVQVRSAETGER